MSKVRRTTVATLVALVLATPALTACNLTSPSTCEAFSLALDANGKGGSGKSSTKTKPKITVKEPKRNSGGTVVVDADPVAQDDDDDCDDD